MVNVISLLALVFYSFSYIAHHLADEVFHTGKIRWQKYSSKGRSDL